MPYYIYKAPNIVTKLRTMLRMLQQITKLKQGLKGVRGGLGYILCYELCYGFNSVNIVR